MQEINRNTETIPSISFSNLLWMFFDALLKFIKHLILFLSKNRILLIVFFIIGLLIGALLNKVNKPQYSLSMMVKHTELNQRTFGYMLEDLNKMAATGSVNELSRVLRLSPQKCSDILSVSGTNMAGTDLTQDTTEQSNKTFLIDLTVADERLSDSLPTAVLGYFNNNPFLSKLKNDKIQLNRERLAFINNELQKLDSLKTIYNRFLSTSGNSSMFYNNAFNPVELYKQSSSYQIEKNAIEEWLRQSSQSIVSIDNTIPTAVPKSMNLVNASLLYGLIFFLLGCLVAAINSVIKHN